MKGGFGAQPKYLKPNCYLSPKKQLVGAQTPTLLLICSSFSIEKSHSLFICFTTRHSPESVLILFTCGVHVHSLTPQAHALQPNDHALEACWLELFQGFLLFINLWCRPQFQFDGGGPLANWPRIIFSTKSPRNGSFPAAGTCTVPASCSLIQKWRLGARTQLPRRSIKLILGIIFWFDFCGVNGELESFPLSLLNIQLPFHHSHIILQVLHAGPQILQSHVASNFLIKDFVQGILHFQWRHVNHQSLTSCISSRHDCLRITNIHNLKSWSKKAR